jgi:hypothetical protein
MNRTRLFHLFLICLFFIAFGCKTNKTIKHHKEGKWIYKDTLNEVLYHSKGKYKKSIEIKTWKYFANKKRIKKEVYRNGICYITNYNEKGQIISIGQSKMVEENNTTHWYYFGDWIYYDDKKQVIEIRKYENGVLISETEIHPKAAN